MMVRAGHLGGQLHQIFQAQVIGSNVRAAQTFPGRHAIAADAARSATSSSSRAKASCMRLRKVAAVHEGQLRLGVMDVVDVQRVQAQVAQAPDDLLAQVARRDAVNAAGEVLGLDDTRGHEVLVDVVHRVGGACQRSRR